MKSTSFNASSLLEIAGESLRGKRIEQRLRLQDLAKLSGVSLNTIRLMETGHDFKISTWISLQRILDPKSIESFFFPPKTVLTPIEEFERLQQPTPARIRKH
jgi:predicted transcriptional regulator